MSGWRPASASARSIDMTGVMPEPPDTSSNGPSPAAGSVNAPDGPMPRSSWPGLGWSCSQFDTRPPATRLTVTEKPRGASGDDEML